jgi:hypothetical protein
MNLLARLLSHGFSVAVVALLIVTFMYRGELFPEWMPEPLPAGTPATATAVAEDREAGAGEAPTVESPGEDRVSAEQAGPMVPGMNASSGTATEDASLMEVAEEQGEPPPPVTAVPAPEGEGQPPPPATAGPAGIEEGEAPPAVTAVPAPEAAPATGPETTGSGPPGPEAVATGEGTPGASPSGAAQGLPQSPAYAAGSARGMQETETAPPAGSPQPAQVATRSAPPAVEPRVSMPPAGEAYPTGPAPSYGAQETSEPDRLLAAAREAFWEHDYEGAVKNYLALTELQPDNPDAYGELGNIYFSQGKWPEAGAAYYEAGVRLVSNKQLEQARELLTVIRGLDSKLATQLEQQIDAASERPE